MQYSIHYSCISHIGNVRRINQDNFICDGHYIETSETNIFFPLCGIKSSKEISIFGVFDGMGGEECGEKASYLAAKNAAILSVDASPATTFAQFCQTVNAEICSYVEENSLSSMGTTAAMLAFSSSGITLCNIGDSKIFRFSSGFLEQISKDHVAVSAFGIKPPLSQNLGIPPSEWEIDPYLAQGNYNDGDLYLICSDGLTDMVDTEEIVSLLASSENTKEATQKLLETALNNGGRDNITIILCKVERNPGWLPSCLKRFIQRKEV